MPFAPDDKDAPQGLDANKLDLPIFQPGWQRWWVAWSAADSSIVGHVDLKGGGLKTQLHRCDLGIGIERPYRGDGLGERLMQMAIGYCRAASSIDWIDLNVFAHNENARALYRRQGFVELGQHVDRFRIGEVHVDDVIMALDVSR